mgnify:FL=1
MKIESLNTNDISIGVLFFEDYTTPYVESSYAELVLAIQAFRPMIDNINKVQRLIDDSKKLKDGTLYGNCIGENERLISFKDGYFQFYEVTLSPDIYLELEQSTWIELLERLKSFMIDQNSKIYTTQF